MSDRFIYIFFIISQQRIGQQVIYNNLISRNHFFWGGGKYRKSFFGITPWQCPCDAAPKGPAEVPGLRIESLKMTVHFSLRAATHRLHTQTHTHPPPQKRLSVGPSAGQSSSFPCAGDVVCVCESRLEQRSYSDSDNEDGDGNEDGADGLKHMTAIRSPPKTRELCGFSADP